ncbi:MAG: hypothetical protein Q9162_005621 [Coniocarpon cinnabarinum]
MSQSLPHLHKLALITGASRGIGAAIARNLASKGATIIANYTSPSSRQKVADLATELRKDYDVSTVPVQVDVGSPDAGIQLVKAVKAEFGENPIISLVVNNAGVSKNQSVADTTAENFGRQYDINVRGPLLIMQSLIPHLPRDRSARIVNVSSVSASLGYPGQSIYGGSKAALEAMTRTWARELADCGTVNAVNPGPVETDMYGGVPAWFEKINAAWLSNTPLSQVTEERDGAEAVRRFGPKGGRPASPEEIAGVVGMLCSQEASFCTGSVVCANGGMRMSS